MTTDGGGAVRSGAERFYCCASTALDARIVLLFLAETVEAALINLPKQVIKLRRNDQVKLSAHVEQCERRLYDNDRPWIYITSNVTRTLVD